MRTLLSLSFFTKLLVRTLPLDNGEKFIPLEPTIVMTSRIPFSPTTAQPIILNIPKAKMIWDNNLRFRRPMWGMVEGC